MLVLISFWGGTMIYDRFVTGHGGRKVPIPYQPVDQVGAEERAAFFTKRSIKKSSKLDALYAIIKMIDLTTLEGADTPGRVKQMCAKARFPIPSGVDQEFSQHPKARPMPSVAAVCVYPSMVPYAVEALAGTEINIASVATAFPSGQLPLDIKLADVKRAVDFGANEIDMVINRGAFLSGDYQTVFDEIIQVKEACGEAHLKVILETGELLTYDRVQFASHLAMLAGADFIKTSTGKVSPAATLPVTLVMLQAIKDYYQSTGVRVGMKPAGGIRNSKMAIQYLCMVNEVLGPEWLTPDLFRFGASSLLNDVLKQIYKQVTGRYYYDKIFSLD
jgi:deoxyribose-phosphate aldolase